MYLQGITDVKQHNIFKSWHAYYILVIMPDSGSKHGKSHLHAKLRKNRRSQPSIEYLSIFSIAVLLIITVLAIVGLTVFNTKSSQTFTQSSCYISAQLNCFQVAVTNNGVSSSAVVVFTNNLGKQINFPNSNAILVQLGSSKSYLGSCYPTNAIQGATVVCNVNVPGYAPTAGTQVNPVFQLNYSECFNNQCNSYKTAGSGTTYASSSSSQSGGAGGIYQVTLLTQPTNGNVSVNGVPYPSNSILYFVNNIYYSIAAPDTLNGNTFQEWSYSGGISISNPFGKYSSAVATSNGVIEATYAPLFSTTSVLPSCYSLTLIDGAGGASATASPSNSVGCSTNYYLSGAAVTLTATASSGYLFSSWTGTLGSTSNPWSYTMPAGSATETANYNPCYALTVIDGTGGSSATASPSNSVGCPSGSYFPGTAITLTATPASGYSFSSWSGTLGSTSNPWSYTMPSSAATETANYGTTTLVTDAPTNAGTNAGTNYASSPDTTIVGSSGYTTTIVPGTYTTTTGCPDPSSVYGDANITLANGTNVRADQIKAGAVILSYNLATHALQPSFVSGVYELVSNNTYIFNNKLKVDSNEIMLINGIWARAYTAKVGDSLFDPLLGKSVAITNITVLNTGGNVYDLIGSPINNYIANGFLIDKDTTYSIFTGGCMSVTGNAIITRADGTTTNVSNVTNGMMVLGYNFITKKLEPTMVIALLSHTSANEYIINNNLKVDAGEVLIVNGNDLQARNLKLGENLFDPLTNKNVTVSSIKVLNGTFTMYDINTAPVDDYIVNGYVIT